MTLCPEQTQTHPSFLPPFPIPFFISSSCFLPNLYHSCFLFISYILSPFSNILFLSPFFPCFISFTYSLPPPFIPSSVRSIRVSLCRLCPSFLASVSFFLTSFSRYLPPSFPFNLFLKVFYFLSKLLFPSLYLSFFPYHLSFHSLFSTLFPLSFFDSLTVSFPLYSLISFFVTFIHFLPPSFLFPCLAYLPSSPCFLFPSLLS